ncbi:apoptotic protease-activating factor 1 [Caerostris extrusa]|uniref:Apoptotic protease-activating factor 1 n=1 Tax=Caerostris extrusa TaxID=172846 RepID=A0AAV4VM67_CAEEX|nr:apoptotic protease-activating factor 1 [Caerostris extrusa]
MELKTDFPTDASCSVLNAKLRKEVIKKRHILLILDDVFNTNIIKAFDIGCPILVTTKILNSVSRISDYTSIVTCGNDLKNDEILFILSRYVNCENISCLKLLMRSEKCIKSPLFTCLIGSYMADIGNNEGKWEDLNKIVNICLEQTRDWKEYKEYYLDFLIFQRHINVTNKVLEILWDKKEMTVVDMMTPPL